MYLSTLDRDFDRLVRRAFGPVAFNTAGSDAFGPMVSGTAAFGPAGQALPMDTVRRDGEVVLRFDVPGVDPEKIDVTVDHGVLTVSAVREEARETESDQVVVRERHYGSATRSVRLSDNLDADKIEATNANGVLEIRIPVREEAKPRKITIGARKELAS